ncbi:MAG: S-layer homology domain-containing protein [Clostridia bacterium]|nr:S-layer homology domain-containing protein [Clostridia bacterium]
MKKFLNLILCAVMMVSFVSSGYAMTQNEIIEHFQSVVNLKETTFGDTADFPWAIKPIAELAKRGIVSGTGNGMFSPQNTVSRYEFVKMITGVCGLVNPDATLPHTDIPKDHWAYVYVASAYEAGLLDIFSKVIFNGVAPITREEIAYVAIEAMIKNGTIGSAYAPVADFTDEDKISDYAKTHVATLNELGVINGRDDGRFSPKDFATRAESAKIIYNILCITETNFN